MNKKHRHLLALLLCFVMTVSLFAGYSETKATSEETTQSEEQTETQETGETREITDMAGRKVTVPAAEDIESVFSTGPVIAVDNELNNSAEAFRFMGELLGVEDHAEELAEYSEKIFTDIASLADIPEDEKVSVYFGNGEDSLETAPRGSQHAQILDAVNVTNVADLELGDGSRVQISAEQLLAWNPDVIVVNGEPKADKSGNSAAEDILSNPDYASLKAVQDNKVYGTPNAPFSWVDRPAGPNRLIGMRWLSAVVYPEYIKCDVNEEIREFFNLFYHVDLSDEQLENVLKGTL